MLPADSVVIYIYIYIHMYVYICTCTYELRSALLVMDLVQGLQQGPYQAPDIESHVHFKHCPTIQNIDGYSCHMLGTLWPTPGRPEKAEASMACQAGGFSSVEALGFFSAGLKLGNLI